MAGLLLGSSTGLGLGDKSAGFQLGPSLTCCVTQESLLFCLGYSVPHKEKTTSPASAQLCELPMESSSQGRRQACHLVASGGMALGLESKV